MSKHLTCSKCDYKGSTGTELRRHHDAAHPAPVEALKLEEQLVVAFLFQEREASAAEIAAHFAQEEYTGPDEVPLDLTSADGVALVLEDLDFTDIVRARRAGERWELRQGVRDLMELATRVAHGGILGVLHG